jgi:hypothetical protein
MTNGYGHGKEKNPMVLRALAAGGFCLGLLVLSGCSGSTGTTVTGSVTVNGEPLKAGAITFMPVQTKGGQSAGGEIVNGKYTARNVTPGQERVTVTVAAEGSREEMMAQNRKRQELLHRGKSAKGTLSTAHLKQGSPGTGEIHEIGTGKQSLDLACEVSK